MLPRGLLPGASILASGFVLAVPAVCVPAPAAAPRAPQVEQRTGPAAGDERGAGTVGGISLERVRRLLRQTPPATVSPASSLLNPHYYVEVVAQSPRIDFFKDFKIDRATAVQYGGMTHAEFLRMTAPPWRKW